MTDQDPDELGNSDINSVVLRSVKKCTSFVLDGVTEIEKKLNDLNVLYYMWGEDTDEDYSADVYAAAVEMFAANALRPLPPLTYAADDEEDAGTTKSSSRVPMPLPPQPPPTIQNVGPPNSDQKLIKDHCAPPSHTEQESAAGQAYVAEMIKAQAEEAQISLAHTTFQAFVERVRFDATMAATHLDRRFAGRLVQRLNSAVDEERLLVTETMNRVWCACPQARGRLLDAVVAELAELAYGYASQHNGVIDLLSFCADTVADKSMNVEPADLEKLFKVFIQLLKHQSLAMFKYKLVKCVRTFNYNNPDLVFRILESITKFWSRYNRTTRILLSIMVELYEWCVRDKWTSLQIRVVGHLSKLFYDEDFQLAEEAMNFWNRILHDNITFWQCHEDVIVIVVNALKKVKWTHWNSDCVKMATCMLNLMVSKNLTKVYDEKDLKKMFQDSDPDMLSYYRYNHVLENKLSDLIIDKPTDTESTVQPYSILPFRR